MDSRNSPLPQFHPIVLKLDRTNYSFWRAQVLPTIRAHGFEEYISATVMPPSPLLPSQSGAAPRPNPEYQIWIRRDQFLLSWMLASIGESMLGHVVRCNTARDVWLTLERLSFSQSKARTMQLRMALQSTRKGNSSIEEYFLKMRGFANQLSAIGQVITDEDLQMYILAGFGMEYEALVVNFMQRPDSPSLQEMQLAFQAYELRLSQQINHYSITEPSANAAFYGGARGSLGRGSGGSRGGFSKFSQSKALICQLCGKIGHVALKCFKRFDVHYTGPTNAADSGNPQALVADTTQEEGSDEQTWYMDSGATNHITNAFGNLSMSADYQGSESVMVGNGNHLSISSVGSSSITLSSSAPQPSLLLNNIFFVPEIAKNLLSISQFTLDNNVLIEFHHNCCFVKDKTTHIILLKGNLVNGLYQLDLSKLSIKHAALCSSLKSSVPTTLKSSVCSYYFEV